ncbi:uncharacterized protein LOC128997030 [Macrosteles quadrilineatus]|uniref:uncharacterized protein LOC128997030 n=1 Tax=Macrosteles quadrilineatus TaxID=74068 RepID=UPI0023E317A6|nr:uncharacterized protein LOC128997030 [Macrosteles quadrilineatus]
MLFFKSGRYSVRLFRLFSTQHQGSSKPPSSSPPPSSSSPPKVDVPGLSSNCVVTPVGEVGPGASKSGAYKNPEYFCYNTTSYFEAEVEMLKYRLPQPSAKK